MVCGWAERGRAASMSGQGKAYNKNIFFCLKNEWYWRRRKNENLFSLYYNILNKKERLRFDINMHIIWQFYPVFVSFCRLYYFLNWYFVSRDVVVTAGSSRITVTATDTQRLSTRFLSGTGGRIFFNGRAIKARLTPPRPPRPYRLIELCFIS